MTSEYSCLIYVFNCCNENRIRVCSQISVLLQNKMGSKVIKPIGLKLLNSFRNEVIEEKYKVLKYTFSG